MAYNSTATKERLNKKLRQKKNTGVGHIDLPKSLCEKTFKQDLLGKCHSRTVLSIEDESKCWKK